ALIGDPGRRRDAIRRCRASEPRLFPRPLRSGQRWSGPEAKANAALAGDPPLMSLHHATHVLTPRGIRRATGIRYLRARWHTRGAVDGGFEKVARSVAPLVTPPVRLVRALRNRAIA